MDADSGMLYDVAPDQHQIRLIFYDVVNGRFPCSFPVQFSDVSAIDHGRELSFPKVHVGGNCDFHWTDSFPYFAVGY